MSDAVPAPAEPAAEAPVSARSDPFQFLGNLDRLAEFVDQLRSSGVKTFEHPCGLRVAFEVTPKLAVPPPTW